MYRVLLTFVVAFVLSFGLGYISRKPIHPDSSQEVDSVKLGEIKLRDAYVEEVTELGKTARNAHLAGDDGPVMSLDKDRAKAFRRYKESVLILYRSADREPPVWATDVCVPNN